MPKRVPLYIIIALWIVLTLPLSGQNISDSARITGDTSIIIDKQDSTLKKKSNFNEIVEFEAQDSMVLLFQDKYVYLYNKAKINSPKTNLESYQIGIALESKELFAKGFLDSLNVYRDKPLLKDDGESYTADSMHYNSKTGKGRVYGLRLAQDEAHIHLGKVLKEANGNFTGEFKVKSLPVMPTIRTFSSTRQK